MPGRPDDRRGVQVPDGLVLKDASGKPMGLVEFIDPEGFTNGWLQCREDLLPFIVERFGDEFSGRNVRFCAAPLFLLRYDDYNGDPPLA